MMNSRLFLYFATIFVITFLSCSNKRYKTLPVESVGIDYISRDSLMIKISDFIDSVHYIQLETNEHCLLGEISKLEYYDRKIFILDVNMNLYVFGDNGCFLNKIGKRGRGPEEYLGAVDFFLDKENNLVGIVDAGVGNFIFYDMKGEFVKKVPVHEKNFWNLIAICRYKNSLLTYMPCYYKTICSFQVYNAETCEYTMGLHPYPMNRTAFSIWTHHPFAETYDGVTFIKPHSDTLFHFNGMSVQPRYIIKHEMPLAPQSFYETFSDQIKFPEDAIFSDILMHLSDHNYFPGVIDIFETRNYLYIHFKEKKMMSGNILWNKNKKNGGYEGAIGEYDKEDIFRLFVGNIIASTDECFICSYNYAKINMYKYFSKRGYHLDSNIEKIISEWEEENNPVVALYYMKKEI